MVGSPRDVLRSRLAVQRLVGGRMATAAEVVRLLTCVQSQEYAHGFWSLGMRTDQLTWVDVLAEFDRADFVRTHILRPTWHFVAAEDIRWILALTSPRVQQANQGRYRQLGLDLDALDRGAELIVRAVSDGHFLTRRELARALEDGGISTDGQRLAYLVMNAELEAAICSGPMRGAQHTYGRLDELVAPSPVRTRDEALRELTRRFFVGHGPAGLKDFTRWSSLTTGDAQTGLELAGDSLQQLEVDGRLLWSDPAAPSPADEETIASQAVLAPLYDEIILSYPQLTFPLAVGHPHPPAMDLFVGSVLVDAVNVGTWRRTVKGRTVIVETDLAPALSRPHRAAVRGAVERLARFLGKELELVGPSAR